MNAQDPRTAPLLQRNTYRNLTEILDSQSDDVLRPNGEDDDSSSDYTPSSDSDSHRRRRRSQAPEPPSDSDDSMRDESSNEDSSADFNEVPEVNRNIPGLHPSANTTRSSSIRAATSSVSKKALITYLRTLHESLAHKHEIIAGFDWRSYRNQPPAALPLAQMLTGIDCRLELMRGEIGSEEYFAYLVQAPNYAITGHIREMEDRVKRMDGFFEGILYVKERTEKEVERAFDERETRVEDLEERLEETETRVGDLGDVIDADLEMTEGTRWESWRDWFGRIVGR